MTTKRTFECNVCRSPITDGNGRGFTFGSERINWETISQAENHICDNCVRCFMAAFRDTGIVKQFGGPVSTQKDSGK